MNKRLKPIPKFANEVEERAFWESPDNDSTEYFDKSKSVQAVFPNLKATTTSISVRLPEKQDEAEKRAATAKRLAAH